MSKGKRHDNLPDPQYTKYRLTVIQILMRLKHISYAQLSKDIGYSMSYLHNAITGQVKASKELKLQLAKYFRIPYGTLLDNDDILLRRFMNMLGEWEM